MMPLVLEAVLRLAAPDSALRVMGVMTAVLLLGLPTAALAQATGGEKAAEDPTKISTVIGVGYAEDITVSGSLAFGPATKINARLVQGGQWSLGASYLFSFGILTVTAGRNEFDNGSVQTRYSIGGFVPVSRMGLGTGQWQVFVPFGYGYTNGEMAVTDVELAEPVLVQVASNSGYLGLFGLRSITARTTLLLASIGSKGSDGYSGLNLGGGLSYHLTASNTLAGFAQYMSNSFGEEQKLGLSFRHKF